jgi:cytochrome c oxidase cbb3-type subunit IV
MYKNVLQTIQNVEIYPIISLVIFVLFFGGMLVWAFRAKREYLSAMANLPLEASGEGGREFEAREEE